MYRYRHIYRLLSIAAFAAGFLLSFWPFSLAGLLFAAATGQYATAVGIGLITDILYGPPVGHWPWLQVPFMLLALILCALHYFLSSYFLKGDSGRL